MYICVIVTSFLLRNSESFHVSTRRCRLSDLTFIDDLLIYLCYFFPAFLRYYYD